MKLKLKLQLFAEGASAGGDAGSGTSAASMATGQEVTAPMEDNLPHLQPRRRKENPLANTKFGIQPEEMQRNQEQTTQESAPKKASFKDLIKGEYAQEAQEWLSGAMAERFKGQRQTQDQLKKQQSLLDKVARRYGVKAGDVDGLAKALEEDDSVYAEAAAEAGMPVTAFKTLEQVTEQRDELLAEKQQQQRDAALRAHFGKLHAQGLELQKQFPSFNLLAEMNNPTFRQMTDLGVSVKDAYFAVHAEEIQKQGMQYAGQEAAKALASSVRAGAMRPLENGIQGGGAVEARRDVRSYSRAERDEINRRARAGKSIIL